MLDRNFLVRLFGFRGAFLHNDPMVADRWRFLQRHLPITTNGERFPDAGSFFFSQLGTRVHRRLGRFGRLVVTPLRIVPPLFDWISDRLGARGYLITFVAYEPRFAESAE